MAALPWYSRHGPDDPLEMKLTPIDRIIVALMARGLEDHEIAAELSIDDQEVRDRIQRIFHHLGVADRLEMVLCLLARRSRRSFPAGIASPSG
jgi:DNA-binding NarL/FixJ family response regulator